MLFLRFTTCLCLLGLLSCATPAAAPAGPCASTGGDEGPEPPDEMTRLHATLSTFREALASNSSMEPFAGRLPLAMYPRIWIPGCCMLPEVFPGDVLPSNFGLREGYVDGLAALLELALQQPPVLNRAAQPESDSSDFASFYDAAHFPPMASTLHDTSGEGPQGGIADSFHYATHALYLKTSSTYLWVFAQVTPSRIAILHLVRGE